MEQDYGIKISLDGFDAEYSGLNGLTFHSGYPVLKIAGSGSGNFIHTDGSNETETIATHNLGYQPLVFIRMDIYNPFTDTVLNYQKIPRQLISGGASIWMSYFFTVDDTDIKIYAETQGGDSMDYLLDYYYFYYYDEDSSINNL